MSPRESPAFMFYADDFLGGTIHMSTLEVGFYIKLLCLQWNSVPDQNGVPPGITKRLLNGVLPKNQKERVALHNVLNEKFVLRSDGSYLNIRLEQVREERETFRLRAAKGGQARAKTLLEAGDKHVLNGKSPSPSPNKGTSLRSSPKSRASNLEEVRDYCSAQNLTMDAESFFDHYESNGWVQARGKPIKDWKAAARNWARRQAEFSGESKSASSAQAHRERMERIERDRQAKERMANAEESRRMASADREEARRRSIIDVIEGLEK